MRRCLTCNSTYDDDVQFCEADGAPLLNLEALAGSPAARRRRAALKTKGVAAAVGLLGGACFVAIFVLSRRPPREMTVEESGRDVIVVNLNQGAPPTAGARPAPTPAAPSDWLRALLGPPASPPPTTPPPEMTPVPTASPTPEAPGKVAGRVEEPRPSPGGGGRDAPASAMTVIRFGDGTSMEVDDVWRDGQGVVWYRRGGVMARIEGRRIKSITRPPVAEGTPPPPPTPQPSVQPQGSPETTPTATPASRNEARAGAGDGV